MTQVPTGQPPRATTATIAGAALAAVILLILAALLTREPGSAAKSIVAVWLAALPVLGLGALCGRLLASRPADGGGPTAVRGAVHRLGASPAHDQHTGRRTVAMRLEARLDAFETRIGARSITAVATGIGLAVAVVAGGIAAVLLVWSLLVQTTP